MQPVLFTGLVYHMNERNRFLVVGLKDDESSERNGTRPRENKDKLNISQYRHTDSCS